MTPIFHRSCDRLLANESRSDKVKESFVGSGRRPSYQASVGLIDLDPHAGTPSPPTRFRIRNETVPELLGPQPRNVDLGSKSNVSFAASDYNVSQTSSKTCDHKNTIEGLFFIGLILIGSFQNLKETITNLRL